jgi:protein-tyrosine kinase
MSRIHEALQRADRERKTAPTVVDIRVADVETDSNLGELLPANAEVVVDNITRRRWTPSLTSLPTLYDRGASVEQFRSLRSHIFQARYEAPLKTILVASGVPSEGKSFVAANLAISLARNSIHNILLIDGDLRRPTLHNLLGAPSSPGLSDYLEGIADLSDILQRNGTSDHAAKECAGAVSNLTFIPSGKSSDHSSELVANGRMEELIASVSPHFDWIVIDAPPVLAVTDAVDLARAADAVLLVARGASTPYEVAQRTKAAFSNSRMLGYVLNAVPQTTRTGTYNYYYGEAEAGHHAKPQKG